MAFDVRTCDVCGFIYETPGKLFRASRRFRVTEEGHLLAECRCENILRFQNAIKQDWFSESLYATSQDAREFFRLLKNPEALPRPSNYSSELMHQVQKCADAQALAKLLSRDQRIMGKVLAAASISAQARSGEPIRGLVHAINYIGLAASQEIVSTFIARSCLDQVPGADEVWEAAEICARLAVFLAANMGFKNDQMGSFFAAGMMANIGKLVQFSINRQHFEKISALMNDPLKPLSYRAAEQLMGATPHEVLTEISLCLWGIPEVIVKAAGEHHREPLAIKARTFLDYWEVIALANQLTYWRLLKPHRMEQGYFRRLCLRFGISEEAAGTIAMENSLYQVDLVS